MIGDLVLTQEEVNPVMSALLENGIEVTALHNHFFGDDPHVYFMHVHGMGTAAELTRRTKPGIKFDAGLKRIYAACYSGAISVFKMDDPDHCRKLEDFPVQKKVHSLAVDQETHRRMRRSKKRTEKRWREWSCTTL